MASYSPHHNKEPRTESEEYVYNFLNEIGVVQYFDIFRVKGYNSESDLPYLTSDDLEKAMMISSARDRQRILQNAKHYRPKRVKEVYEWLLVNNLEHYYINFEQNELTDMQKIAQLQLPDENIYFDLEITMPGHKKRLERAVARLKQNLIPEKPVIFGRWGKPSCLPQAKFDFLCVKASIFSHKKPAKKVCIDFMVDSGSDVSTVQEEILNSLDLELLGPIYSCGIHGGNHTNLYKARLKIGDEEMDIEIMGSNYDSLGSRVVRHFRHVIDGQHHVWLKGNFKEPLPAVIPLPAPKVMPSIAAATSLPSVSPGSTLPSALLKPSALFNAGPSTSTETSNADLIKRKPEKRKMASSTSDANAEPQPKMAHVSVPASFSRVDPSNSTKASSKAFSQLHNRAHHLISTAHSNEERSSRTVPRESLVTTEVSQQPAGSFTSDQQNNELEKCASHISGISLARNAPHDSKDCSEKDIRFSLESLRTGHSSASIGLPSVSTGLPSASTGLPSASTGLPSVNTGLPSVSTYLSPASTGLPSANTGQSSMPPRISEDMIVDPEERISVGNLMPTSLQDTNDDIDFMTPGHEPGPNFIWIDNWSKSNRPELETDQGENIEVVHVLATQNGDGLLENNLDVVDIDSEPFDFRGNQIASGIKQGDFIQANSNIMLLSIDELEIMK